MNIHRLRLGRVYPKWYHEAMYETYIGSGFDNCLAEEGMLVQVEAIAIMRVIAYQIRQLMDEQNLSKSAMARRMNTSRAALERLVDPKNQSVTINTMEKAAQALGKRLQIVLV